MSANFLKFKCTWTGRGKFICGQRAMDYGDVVILPSDQAAKYVKHSDIAKGYIEFLGSVADSEDGFSANIQGYLEGKSGNFKKNYLPASMVTLKNAGVTAVQGDDAGAFVALDRDVALTKLLVRMPIATAGVDAPRYLVTAGDMVKVTPTTLRYYDNNTDSYGAMTNGSISGIAPITWAANDLMIVGYTEKFKSVNVTMTTPTDQAGAINQVYYWNGAAWTAVDTFTDYTMEPAATNSFDRAAATDTNVRVTWWESPTDWVPGGPATSGIPHNAYAIALRVSDILTNLVGGRLYPILDTPLADVNFGLKADEAEAVVAYNDTAAAYRDYTGTLATFALAAAQYVYLGFAQPVGGVYFDVTATDATAETLSVAYWAGQSAASGWSGQATVALDTWAGTMTDGSAALANDGALTWASQPSDWVKASYTELPSAVAATFAALGTVTTDELYWLRIQASGAMDVDNTARFYAVIGNVAWYSVEPKNSHIAAGEKLHVHVIDEEATASTQILAVLADI
jgi:hypothetical protein